MLGKFFAEAIEEIDEGPLDALRAAGAGTLQRIAFGVIPQVLPNWVGVILYRFETNIRVSTVLGMVGAGGIGFELISSMKLFKYEDTATCVIVILVLVLGADLVSSKLRAIIR
jgi:phosphonate transport system permease protein